MSLVIFSCLGFKWLMIFWLTFPTYPIWQLINDYLIPLSYTYVNHQSFGFNTSTFRFGQGRVWNGFSIERSFTSSSFMIMLHKIWLRERISKFDISLCRAHLTIHQYLFQHDYSTNVQTLLFSIIYIIKLSNSGSFLSYYSLHVNLLIILNKLLV